MQAAAEDVDVEAPRAAAVKDIIGLGLPEAISELFPGLEAGPASQLRLRYSQRFVEFDRIPSDLFDGALETLNGLREAGHMLAVATGKSRRGLSRVLASLELERFFDATRCADETLSKPDPLMLNELLQELDCPAHEAVMIGDTEYDLAMAVAANVAGVGVSYGSHSPERLQRHGPMAIVDTLPELLELDF
jgi:phosphoglycolate phosphatase